MTVPVSRAATAFEAEGDFNTNRAKKGSIDDLPENIKIAEAEQSLDAAANVDHEKLRKKYLLQRFWHTAKGFWSRQRGDRLAWLLSFSLLVLILVNLAAMGSAQSAVAGGATRLARLAELRAELDQALAAWAPLRADLALATRLASFAEGKSADNRLQMSLSAYVVAYRLTQVVAAANERLAVMSDRRYQLEHSAGRGAGDRRGGLALHVRDDWSGEARDPATLSGGETFVVSLALALGLADVIGHESGGADQLSHQPFAGSP